MRLIDAQPFEGTRFNQDVDGLIDPFKWARMGSAIYPTLALVNHSCDSNCIRVFFDKRAALITTRVVTAGEELTESYREARAKGFWRGYEIRYIRASPSPQFARYLYAENPNPNPYAPYSGVHHCDTPLFARQFSCQGILSRSSNRDSKARTRICSHPLRIV